MESENNIMSKDSTEAIRLELMRSHVPRKLPSAAKKESNGLIMDGMSEYDPSKPLFSDVKDLKTSPNPVEKSKACSIS
jgi:hypothetical protein